jgi:hypothetical protein
MEYVLCDLTNISEEAVKKYIIYLSNYTYIFMTH